MKKQGVAFVFILLSLISLPCIPLFFPVIAQTQSFDPSKVTPIYSNAEIVGLELHSAWVGVNFTGFHKQEVFAAISSPWEPKTITSSNVLQPFTELEYDPLTMSVNPIVETTLDYAWDYDSENEVVSLKLILTSTDTKATVRVAMYYTLAVDITGFSSSKLNYSVLESIDVYANVSADYLVENTSRWLIEVLILQNSTEELFQKASEEIALETGERKELHYNFRQITEAGAYVAAARVYDPTNGNVVACSQFTFHVWGPSPSQGEIAIQDWLRGVFLSIFVIAVSMLVYARFRDRILGLIKRKPKPS